MTTNKTTAHVGIAGTVCEWERKRRTNGFLCDGNGGRRRLNRSLTSGGADGGGYSPKCGGVMDRRRPAGRCAVVPASRTPFFGGASHVRTAVPRARRKRTEGRRDADVRRRCRRRCTTHARSQYHILTETRSRAQRSVASSFHFGTRRPQRQLHRGFPRAPHTAGRITKRYAIIKLLKYNSVDLTGAYLIIYSGRDSSLRRNNKAVVRERLARPALGVRAHRRLRGFRGGRAYPCVATVSITWFHAPVTRAPVVYEENVTTLLMLRVNLFCSYRAPVRVRPPYAELPHRGGRNRFWKYYRFINCNRARSRIISRTREPETRSVRTFLLTRGAFCRTDTLHAKRASRIGVYDVI